MAVVEISVLVVKVVVESKPIVWLLVDVAVVHT
jgi:hypothetical protein